MAKYRFNYRFDGDPLPSEFGANFDSDIEAERWWQGFAANRGNAVLSILIERSVGEAWTAVGDPVAMVAQEPTARA